MIKQSWMVIVAGETLINEMEAEQRALIKFNGVGYDSNQLCALQAKQANRGIEGAEIVVSAYGCSVRSDSGLQNFALLASARHKDVNGTLEDAERWVRNWVSENPSKRYAWRRK